MEHNVALVDDHHLMRNGLVGMVNSTGDYRVTMEAGNGRELVDQLQAMDLDGPDAPVIAVVDLNMPVMDGYATIAWITVNAPRITCLVLTLDATDEAMVRAVHAGARGYVLKSARPSILKLALDSLVTTGYYYSELMIEAQGRRPDDRSTEDLDRVRVNERITDRELEFLLLVCDEAELTYDEISRRMGVQRRTVDNYRTGLFEKFGIRSKTGLVLFAMRWRLLEKAR